MQRYDEKPNCPICPITQKVSKYMQLYIICNYQADWSKPRGNLCNIPKPQKAPIWMLKGNDNKMIQFNLHLFLEQQTDKISARTTDFTREDSCIN